MDKTNKIIYIYISIIVILLVLIVGVTFAYFVAKGEEVGFDGNTATVGLELSVNRVSSRWDQPLMPQNTDTIASAVIGTNNESCVDSNGNTVCQVYEIVIENKSNISIDLTGEIRLKADTIADLRWGLGDSATTGFSPDKTYSKDTTDLIGPSDDSELQKITLAEKDDINDANIAKFYVVIYLPDVQTGTNTGEFTGEVEFYSADGGIKATFES